jgi:hypothetical protein
MGGEAPRIHVVTEAEVDKYKLLLREQLRRVARGTIEKQLDDTRQASGSDYALLSGDTVSFS